MENFKFNERRISEINSYMKAIEKANTSAEKVSVYRKYEQVISEMTPIDIFYLEDYQDQTQLSISEIKATANRFVNVFHKGLSKYTTGLNHQIFIELIKENRGIEKHLNALKQYLKKENPLDFQEQLLQGFRKCSVIEQKYNKFENIIFPNLETKTPSNKPFEVLWDLHDDARELLKDIINLLQQKTVEKKTLSEIIGKYYFMIFGINQKEELIILPTMNILLDNKNLDKIFNECVDVGFAFNTQTLQKKKVKITSFSEGFFKTETGSLSFKNLSAMLNHLPVDITFVDKDNFVRYYNQSKNRHFPRNPSVIGRLVKNCHPPKSVDVVEKIINDFKNNKKDYEEFWINFKEKMLYIIYYAVRDDEGDYLGVLEVSQDVTKFLNLKGEKRLL